MDNKKSSLDSSDVGFKDYIDSAIAESISVKTQILRSMTVKKQIHIAAEKCIDTLKAGGKILLAGNGGSAADAQHIAAEFVSRFEFDRPGLSSIALTVDTSMLTAIGNDYGFEEIFSRQIEANGWEGDTFIALSTSGCSKNILNAVNKAHSKGIKTIGFAGHGGDLPELCEVNIRVPSSSTARIQESHILIGHIICGIVEATMFKSV